MQSKILFISALLGAVCGLLSTYPFELGPAPSILFWGIAGILLGLFAKGTKTVVWSGILYGVFLAVFFLFSRFGGTAEQIAGYSLFVAASSLAAAIGGIVAVFIGSKLRQIMDGRQKASEI